MIAWLMFLHFLADFPLQTRWMAENKSSNWRALGAHVGVQWLVFFFGTLVMPLGWSLAFASANALIHGAIDRNLWRGYKRFRRFEIANFPEYAYWKDSAFWTFLGFDQLLHGLTLVALLSWLT